MDHDCFVVPKAWLMNAIDYLYWVKIAPIPLTEASYLIVNDLLKLGRARIVMVVMAFFNAGNAFSASSVNYKCPLFLKDW